MQFHYEAPLIKQKLFLKAAQRLLFQHLRIFTKKYMYFSYALTLSAITLRLWKYIIANTLALPPQETYIIVAWLAWTLNLLFAFWILGTDK